MRAALLLLLVGCSSPGHDEVPDARLSGGGLPDASIAAGDRAGYVFAVLPDKILVELTAQGFRAIPR